MLASSGDKRTLCVGMCVLDIIHVCEEYPREDSDKRCEQGRWQRGGNASNNCTVLALLDCKTEFLGVLSNVPMSRFVIDDCIQRGIGIDNCVRYEHKEIPLSSVILSQKTGTRTIIHSNPGFPILTFKEFQSINLQQYKWIHFEARNFVETIDMMKMIRNDNNKTISDPITISVELEKQNAEHLGFMKIADVAFVGKDFSTFMGWADLGTALRSLRSMTENKNCCVICLWGTKGVAAVDGTNTVYECKSYSPEKVVDTLGAGDTFCAAAIYAMQLKLPMNKVLEFACRIAGAKVGFYGYDGISSVYSAILDIVLNKNE